MGVQLMPSSRQALQALAYGGLDGAIGWAKQQSMRRLAALGGPVNPADLLAEAGAPSGEDTGGTSDDQMIAAIDREGERRRQELEAENQLALKRLEVQRKQAEEDKVLNNLKLQIGQAQLLGAQLDNQLDLAKEEAAKKFSDYNIDKYAKQEQQILDTGADAAALAKARAAASNPEEINPEYNPVIAALRSKYSDLTEDDWNSIFNAIKEGRKEDLEGLPDELVSDTYAALSQDIELSPPQRVVKNDAGTVSVYHNGLVVNRDGNVYWVTKDNDNNLTAVPINGAPEADANSLLEGFDVGEVNVEPSAAPNAAAFLSTSDPVTQLAAMLAERNRVTGKVPVDETGRVAPWTADLLRQRSAERLGMAPEVAYERFPWDEGQARAEYEKAVKTAEKEAKKEAEDEQTEHTLDVVRGRVQESSMLSAVPVEDIAKTITEYGFDPDDQDLWDAIQLGEAHATAALDIEKQNNPNGDPLDLMFAADTRFRKMLTDAIAAKKISPRTAGLLIQLYSPVMKKLGGSDLSALNLLAGGQ